MKKLILIGAGGHCLSCIEVIENQNKFKIVGVIDSKKNKNIKYSLIGNDTKLNVLRKKFNYAFVSLGQIKTASLRKKIFIKIEKLNYIIPKIVSKYSYISKETKIDKGTIIMNNVVCNAYSSIGKNCIVNTSSIIEHGVAIGNHCHISTGAILNGDTKVGDGTFIGSNAIIKEGVIIGKNCIIGAGAVLKKNLKNNQIYK